MVYKLDSVFQCVVGLPLWVIYGWMPLFLGVTMHQVEPALTLAVPIDKAKRKSAKGAQSSAEVPSAGGEEFWQFAVMPALDFGFIFRGSPELASLIAS